MRGGLSAQTFGILVTLAGFLILILVPRGDTERSPALNIFPRQVQVSASVNSSPAAAPSPATSETASSQTATTPTAASSTPQQQQQPTSTTTTPSSTPEQQSSTQAPASSTNKPSNAAASSVVPSSITSALVTTNQGGQVITSIVVVADTTTPSGPPSPSSSSSNSSGGGGSSGISSSTIIGLSVAGGVAVLCVVGFFVWKFTRKRIGDYDNNEEIKWPELNAHDTAVPLPTNRTGGAGFDTVPEGGRSSIGGYAPSTAANSTAELPDPYAIPPLPHLDPNQPYRDDPNAAYYDPYRGPVPQSFSPVGPGEVIPMTQLAGTGRRSPGPGAAYAGDFGSGRASPALGMHAAYGSGSGDYGGRASPAPAYGSSDYGGRASPGPRAAQQGRSVSPGPQAAYGNVYGPR